MHTKTEKMVNNFKSKLDMAKFLIENGYNLILININGISGKTVNKEDFHMYSIISVDEETELLVIHDPDFYYIENELNDIESELRKQFGEIQILPSNGRFRG